MTSNKYPYYVDASYRIDPAKGLPPIPENLVPTWQVSVDAITDPVIRDAAQEALDARDLKILKTVLYDWYTNRK